MRTAIPGNTAKGRSPAVSSISRTSLRAIASSKVGTKLPLAMLAPRTVTLVLRSIRRNSLIASSGETSLACAMVSTSASTAATPMIMALPNSLLTAARSERSPRYSMRLVIFESSALTLSKISLDPATIIEPCALSAAAGPMKTGQCRYFSPWAASRCARAAVKAGSVVV